MNAFADPFPDRGKTVIIRIIMLKKESGLTAIEN
jgi:hypothetical protein